jgi:hypothetical protein
MPSLILGLDGRNWISHNEPIPNPCGRRKIKISAETIEQIRSEIDGLKEQQSVALTSSMYIEMGPDKLREYEERGNMIFELSRKLERLTRLCEKQNWGTWFWRDARQLPPLRWEKT